MDETSSTRESRSKQRREPRLRQLLLTKTFCPPLVSMTSRNVLVAHPCVCAMQHTSRRASNRFSSGINWPGLLGSPNARRGARSTHNDCIQLSAPRGGTPPQERRRCARLPWLRLAVHRQKRGAAQLGCSRCFSSDMRIDTSGRNGGRAVEDREVAGRPSCATVVRQLTPLTVRSIASRQRFLSPYRREISPLCGTIPV